MKRKSGLRLVNTATPIVLPQDGGARGPAMLRRQSEIRETMDAGITHRAMLDTTAIDKLYFSGRLGRIGSVDALRRYDAMIWIRSRLDDNRPRVGGSYQPKTDFAAGSQDRALEINARLIRLSQGIGQDKYRTLREIAYDDWYPEPWKKHGDHVLASMDAAAQWIGITGQRRRPRKPRAKKG